MKAVRVLVFICLICLCASQANAGGHFKDGNELMDWAVEVRKRQHGQEYDGSDVGFFMLYVYGLYDGVSFGTPYLDHLPSKISIDQICDIYANYLIENPKIRHRPAPEVFLMAITAAYPVPKSVVPKSKK